MQDRYCDVCSKVLIRKTRKDGYPESNREFINRVTCPGKCSNINRSKKIKAGLPKHIEDPDKICPICNKVIGHYSKQGHHIPRIVYNRRKTCATTLCKSEGRKKRKKKIDIISIELSAIDLFNAGRGSEVESQNQ